MVSESLSDPLVQIAIGIVALSAIFFALFVDALVFFRLAAGFFGIVTGVAPIMLQRHHS